MLCNFPGQEQAEMDFANRIGKELCYLLPLVHTLTGCDYTSKVGTKHAALIANPTEYLKDFDSVVMLYR